MGRPAHRRGRTRVAIALAGGTAAVTAGVTAALFLMPGLFARFGPQDATPPGDAVTPAGQGGSSPPAATEEKLARWRAFPADRVPRPLVVLGDLPVMVDQIDAAHMAPLKAALTARAFRLLGQLPAATPRRLDVDLPGGRRQSYPAISARSAFDAMSAPGSDPGSEPGSEPGSAATSVPPFAPTSAPTSAAVSAASSAAPIGITRAELGTAAMRTDRGTVHVPSWIFHTARGGSFAWPAITPDAFWRLGRMRASPMASDASADAGGTRLSIRMPAAPPACPGAPRQVYGPSVLESTTAVVVGLSAVTTTGTATGTATATVTGTATGAAVPGCHVIDTDVLRTAVYEVRLARPLAGRILVYADGAPIPVADRRA